MSLSRHTKHKKKKKKTLKCCKWALGLRIRPVNCIWNLILGPIDKRAGFVQFFSQPILSTLSQCLVPQTMLAQHKSTAFESPGEKVVLSLRALAIRVRLQPIYNPGLRRMHITPKTSFQTVRFGSL